MILFQGYTGQQPTVQAWGKSKLVAALNYRAHAIVVVNRSASTFYVQVFDQPTSDTTGSLDGSGIPRYDVPVPANGVFSLTHSQFYTGLFIRAVTAAGGATLIATNDAKITVEGTVWPVSTT